MWCWRLCCVWVRILHAWICDWWLSVRCGTLYSVGIFIGCGTHISKYHDSSSSKHASPVAYEYWIVWRAYKAHILALHLQAPSTTHRTVYRRVISVCIICYICCVSRVLSRFCSDICCSILYTIAGARAASTTTMTRDPRAALSFEMSVGSRQQHASNRAPKLG